MISYLKGFEIPVPKALVPSASVIWNRKEESRALQFGFSPRLIKQAKWLGWGDVSVEEPGPDGKKTGKKVRSAWVVSEFEPDGSIRFRLTRDNIKGACLEIKRKKRAVKRTLEYYRHRIVYRDYPWLVLKPSRDRRRKDAEIVSAVIRQDRMGRVLVLKLATVSAVPEDVCSRAFPRSPGRKAISGRKSNGRKSKPAVAVVASPADPSAVPGADIQEWNRPAHPEADDKPVVGFTGDVFARKRQHTPGSVTMSALSDRIAALDERLGKLETMLSGPKPEAVAADDAGAKSLEDRIASAGAAVVARIEAFGESQCSKIGGTIKSVYRRQRELDLLAQHKYTTEGLAAIAKDKADDKARKEAKAAKLVGA